MHHDPGAGLAAFVARGVRNVGVAKTLLALAHQHALFEMVAVIDRAFALQHVGDRLDVLVVMRFGDRARRHRHHVHADLLRADRLFRGARAICNALFAEISLARFDQRKAVVWGSRHHALRLEFEKPRRPRTYTRFLRRPTILSRCQTSTSLPLTNCLAASSAASSLSASTGLYEWTLSSFSIR